MSNRAQNQQPNRKHNLSEWVVVVISALAYLVVVITSQWPTFSISYPIAEYERRYSQSQYVLGDRKTYEMGDGEIYTYAGIRYIQGEDVTQIQFDAPPLIKYLYGLSYVVTGKPNWILVPLIMLAITSYWFINCRLFAPGVWRWVSLSLFLGHSIIYKALPQTMLDFPMTAFLLLATALFLRFYEKPNVVGGLLFGLSSGLVILTKYPFPLLLGYFGLLFGFLFISRVSLKYLFVSACALVSTYLIAHTSYFIHGHSLVDYLHFEWWRLHWFMGKVDAPKGMIWQTLFLGRYPKWWANSGEYIRVLHWNIMWPISFLLYAASFVYVTKHQRIILPYFIWIILSLAAYSLGVAEDRFLVPLVPGFAIGSTLTLQVFSKKIRSQAHVVVTRVQHHR